MDRTSPELLGQWYYAIDGSIEAYTVSCYGDLLLSSKRLQNIAKEVAGAPRYVQAFQTAMIPPGTDNFLGQDRRARMNETADEEERVHRPVHAAHGRADRTFEH